MRGIRGITLIALVITIIVLLILAGISLYSGRDTLEKAKLQELKTNMLLIQAKAREYVEEVNFRMGIGTEEEKNNNKITARKEIYEETEKLKALTKEEIKEQFEIEVNDTGYQLTQETKEKWGLDKIEKEGQYFLIFDEIHEKVEVYYTQGYNGKYSLTDIDQIQE